MHCKNYVGVTCVNGGCPMALAEEYAECCMPIIRDCEDYPFNNGCEDCALSETEYCVK